MKCTILLKEGWHFIQNQQRSHIATETLYYIYKATLVSPTDKGFNVGDILLYRF